MKFSIYTRVKFAIKSAQNRLTRKQFIFLSSILVGLTAGLAAIVLKTFVHYIFFAATYEKLSNFKYLYLVLPLIGIFLTVLVVKKVLKGKLNKGLSQIHYSIAKKSSILPKSQMYDQVITSSLTIGLGGSTGLEAPIVVTGAALGSNFSRTYHLNNNERTLLLACGIAAGIGAAFNAPIAGVLFALEVLLLDISISAFTPLILAAATGALISRIILHDDILLTFKLKQSFDYTNVPFYAVLGILAGLISVYHSRAFTKIEGLFHRQPGKEYRKVLFGGLALAVLIAIFPSLFGEGYQSIKILSDQNPEKLLDNSIIQMYQSNEWVVLSVIGVLIFLKSIATGLTLGSGGNGGNFAPALFVGAYLGFFFSRILNMLNFTKIAENNFTIVGMAGVLSGIYHAPLTAIFLIAEITGGYTLMIPLMIVSSISFAISRYFEPFSMDTKQMVQSGDIITDDRDQSVLSNISTSDFIDADYPHLSMEDSLQKVVEIVSKSNRNVFPVTDKENNLLGIIELDNIREVMFRTELYDSIYARDLLTKVKVAISSTERMQEVMKHFDDTGNWILPVVDDNKFVGFISKSSVFSGYRTKLKDTTIG